MKLRSKVKHWLRSNRDFYALRANGVIRAQDMDAEDYDQLTQIFEDALARDGTDESRCANMDTDDQ